VSADGRGVPNGVLQRPAVWDARSGRRYLGRSEAVPAAGLLRQSGRRSRAR